MKTTIDIPDREMVDVLRFTGAKSKRAAVIKAVADFNRRQRIAALVKYSGSFEDFPSLNVLRETDEERDHLSGLK